jgi:hypothetical protein
MVYRLYGYDTESRSDRVREYTSSEREAARWGYIKRVQFSDSGHGIVFGAERHHGKRLPVRPRTEHVINEIQRIKAEEKS